MNIDYYQYIIPALSIAILLKYLIRSITNRQKVSKFKEEYISRYAGQTVYFCDACEDVGKNLVQFFGDPFGGDIKPNDLITLPNGQQFPILEVYGADSTPSEPDSKITPGMLACAIVIDSPNFNFTQINQALKTDSVIVLKITPKK